MTSLEKVHPDCLNFVTIVEELLAKRQQDVENATHIIDPNQTGWGPRTWLRTEMEDMVYSSYKQMRRGRITRPPKREKVMEIADYLNCTLDERNRLLLAANTTPINIYVTGEELEALLQPNIAITETLDIPAMVINRDWHIHFLNRRMLALYDINPAELEQIPNQRRNLLGLLFDNELPLHGNLIDNRPSWLRMARQNIYAFKVANQLCQFETWYQQLVDGWMQFPEFEHHWRTVRTDISFRLDESVQDTPEVLQLDTRIPHLNIYATLRPLLISAGYYQFEFPQVMALAPIGEDARITLSVAGALG